LTPPPCWTGQGVIGRAISNGQRLDRFSGEREAVGEVAAVPRHEPNATAPTVRENAEAVVFDFVNPAPARRRLFGWARQAGIEAGRGLPGA